MLFGFRFLLFTHDKSRIIIFPLSFQKERMLSQFQKLTKISFQRPVVNFAAGARFFSQASAAPIKPSIVEKTANRKVVDEGKVILLTKKHIKQSPLKMKFLVRLVRNAWIPDAVAQMKFSPKHRAEDIARIINVWIVVALFFFYLF